MKKLKTLMITFILLASASYSYAFYPPETGAVYGRAKVTPGFNYNNPVRTPHKPQAVKQIVITNDSTPNIITPPPPPPPRHRYHYKDFAGGRRFHRRSYYIPSYCMPGTIFHDDIYNPFCNQYRPYGSNLYISF